MSQPDAHSATPEIQMFFDEAFECYNRHDFDAMLEMYAVDAVFDVSRVMLDENPRQGHEDIRAYWDQMWDIRAYWDQMWDIPGNAQEQPTAA